MVQYHNQTIDANASSQASASQAAASQAAQSQMAMNSLHEESREFQREHSASASSSGNVERPRSSSRPLNGFVVAMPPTEGRGGMTSKRSGFGDKKMMSLGSQSELGQRQTSPDSASASQSELGQGTNLMSATTAATAEVSDYFDKFMKTAGGVEEDDKGRWLARFNLTVGAVIFINSIVIAIETDHRTSDPSNQAVFLAIEHFFVAFFVLEFCVRIKLEKLTYFRSAWNWLDFICVMGSVLDVWVLPLFAAGDTGLRSLSILRVLRLLRVVRLLRLFKMFRDLYVIISSFAASLKSIFWVTILMGLGNFFCSILVTQLIGQNSYFADVKIGDDDISMRFGTVPRSMYSLFELLMLEGWNEVGRPLVERSPWLILFFICFFMVFTFGLLNMIVGMVVEQTIEQSKANDHRIQKEAEKELKKLVMGLKDFFLAVDVDGSGELSFEEFEQAVSTRPDIINVLEQTDIPSEQWEDLFHILDVDGNGKLSVEEFLGGILRVRGTARNRDLVATHMTVTRICNQQSTLLAEVVDAKKATVLTAERIAALEAMVTQPLPEEPKATQPSDSLEGRSPPHSQRAQVTLSEEARGAEASPSRAIEPD